MASAPTARLSPVAILIEAAGRQRRVSISTFPFSLGRSDECDAAIPDVRVSRVHARIVKVDDAYFIVDAGSRHGTFVNGERRERAPLSNKDEVRLGAGVKIIFLCEESTGSSATLLLARLSSNSDGTDLEKLRLFLEAARSLSSGMVLQEVLCTMLSYALKISRAERGFVYLKDKRGKPAFTCGIDSSGAAITHDGNVSHSVVNEAMVSASELITEDASLQAALAGRQSIMLNDLRTVVAIPLRVRHGTAHAQMVSEVDGVLYLDSKSVSQSITGVSPDVLRALANECAAVLESAKLVAAEQAASLYRQEMEIAAGIQHSLISFPVSQSDFARVVGQSIPCREIGGDFFDINISPDAVTVIVVDVSGKGVSAALLASVIHGMFYSQIASGATLVNAVSSINRFLCSRVAGQKYATLMAAQLPREGTLQIVNCGHVPALLACDGSINYVTDGDFPVGLIGDAVFHSIQCDFPAGSRLCILTDGISETENRAGEEFGTCRVEPCLLSDEPVSRVMSNVVAFSDDLEAQDDRTIVVLERTR
jgi:sigma-B regulation protein RsbU (phosphoserine phosphatase)